MTNANIPKPPKKYQPTPQGRKVIKGTIQDQLHRTLRLYAFQDGVLMFDIVEAALVQYFNTRGIYVPSVTVGDEHTQTLLDVTVGDEHTQVSPTVTLTPDSNIHPQQYSSILNNTTTGLPIENLPEVSSVGFDRIIVESDYNPVPGLVAPTVQSKPTLVARLEQAGEEYEAEIKAKESRVILNDLTSIAEDRRVAAEADGTLNWPAPEPLERVPDVVVPPPVNYSSEGAKRNTEVLNEFLDTSEQSSEDLEEAEDEAWLRDLDLD